MVRMPQVWLYPADALTQVAWPKPTRVGAFLLVASEPRPSWWRVFAPQQYNFPLLRTAQL